MPWTCKILRRFPWRVKREVSGVLLPDSQLKISSPVKPALARVDSYLNGPFVVVVGTGGHAERQLQNVQWAQDFARRWVAHSQGTPTIVFDREFDAGQYRDHHWVLIGGPRSNSQTAEGFQNGGTNWPVQFDARTLTVAGTSYARSSGIGVVFAVADTQRPDRTTIIAEGQPFAAGGAFPWAGCGSVLWQVGDQPPRFNLKKTQLHPINCVASS